MGSREDNWSVSFAKVRLSAPAPDWKRPAVIVVPGGAYWGVSKREGEPVASQFLARGFQTFILTYLCSPDGVSYPEQLIELSAAVDYVKKHAAEYNVNADEVFVVGFSAGGHLTADLAVEYASVKEKSGLELDCRPKAVGLGYPVISSKAGHEDSYINLLSGYTEEARGELMKSLDLDQEVTDDTPPAFIWTTSTDTCVPSRQFSALRLSAGEAQNSLRAACISAGRARRFKL